MKTLATQNTMFKYFLITCFFLTCFSSILSAQVFAEESKWEQLLALDEKKTKLIFSITEECTDCFAMFLYVDYLYKHKRDDVEVYVVVSKRTGSSFIYKTMESVRKKYGYTFHYYMIDDGGYNNAAFNKNPRTYIVDHKKLASEVYYEMTKAHKEAILSLVKKDAVKTVDEVLAFYRSKNTKVKQTDVQNKTEKEDDPLIEFYRELDQLLTNSLNAATKRTSNAESLKDFINKEGGVVNLTPEMVSIINQTLDAKDIDELITKISELTEEQANVISKSAYTKADEIARDPEKKVYFASTTEALREFNIRKVDQKLFVEVKAAIEEASSDTIKVNGKEIPNGEKEVTQAELNKIVAIVEGYEAEIKLVNVDGENDIIQVERKGHFIIRAGVTFENDRVDSPKKAN